MGGAGSTLVEGTIDEAANVTVNGENAVVTSLPGGDFLFRREIPVNEGSNTITIEATDASENSATQSYNVFVGGVQKVLEYDLNGNLRYEKDDQGVVLREFEWDARNRLVAIVDGANRSEFEYDGLDRRVRIVEKESGVEVSNETYLWAGSEILQKRNDSSTTVLRNYFEDGFEEGSDSFFYTKDHLGSIREVIADDGTTVEAVYDYSPWGEVTKIGGTGVESDFLYTGHFYHEESDLFLTWFRAYDPELGRWISRDSIEEAGGINLYSYILNRPISSVDPLGLIIMNPMIDVSPEAISDAHQIRRDGHNLYPGPDNSASRHIYGSRELTEATNAATARAYGVVNEVQGLVLHDIPRLRSRILGETPWAFSIDDLFMNEIGIDNARQKECDSEEVNDGSDSFVGRMLDSFFILL
nr:RHS repeat-associated core domain-containing protein [Puniceicoccus vermicola]